MRYTDYSGPDGRAVEDAKRRLREDLTTPGLPRLVEAYFDPAGSFAGRTFDCIGQNPAEKISSDDLLAVTLLGVRWSPLAVRQLMPGGEKAAAAAEGLAKIRVDADLWDATDVELRVVDELWYMLCGLRGVQDTLASKLLARKRPRLAPITDSVIVAAIGARGQTWPTLRRCLQDKSFRDDIEKLRQCAGSEGASILRLFDVALWMLYSGSENAQRARAEAGVIRPEMSQ